MHRLVHLSSTYLGLDHPKGTEVHQKPVPVKKLHNANLVQVSQVRDYREKIFQDVIYPGIIPELGSDARGVTPSGEGGRHCKILDQDFPLKIQPFLAFGQML